MCWCVFILVSFCFLLIDFAQFAHHICPSVCLWWRKWKYISLRQIVDGCFVEYWQKKSEYLTVYYVNLCFPRCSGVSLAPKWTKTPSAALKYGLSVNRTHCFTSTSTTSIPHNFPAVLYVFDFFFLFSSLFLLRSPGVFHRAQLRAPPGFNNIKTAWYET